MRNYTELSQLKTFAERFDYLKFEAKVGDRTFGDDRFLNQKLYTSPEWRRIRRQVIIRDGACDLGDPNYPIKGKVIIHHMNPIRPEDILNRNPDILNPEYLICVSHKTHNDIEFGLLEQKREEWKPRSENDTCPWRK